MHRPTLPPFVPAVLTMLAGALLPRSGSSQQADPKPISIGFERRIESQVLGETRRLLISLPEGHAKSETRYPVLFLLDGDTHFAHTAALLRFEAEFGRIPPSILLAIPNTDRTRDLTPPTETDDFPTAGGADNLLRFLREEIVPLVETDYRASDHRTLIGHSFGGMTVLHCLVHHPDDYQGYLAISPSLWWDDQRLLGQAAAAFPLAERRDLRLFLTLGNEGGEMLAGYRRMEALLSERSPDGLQWAAKRMPDESHQTVPYRSTIHGLRFLFRPWALQDLGSKIATGGWELLDREREALTRRYGRTRARDFRILVQITDELLDARRFADLAELYRSAPPDLPVPPVAWEVFGERSLAAGEREAALEAYTAALRANPRSQTLRETLREIGGDPDAIPRPAALDPERARALVGTYREQGEASKLFLVVEYEQDRLFATLPRGGRAPLELDEGNTFRLFEGFIRIEFRFAEGAERPTDLVFAPQREEPRILSRDTGA